MWGVEKDKDLKLALIGKSGVVGFVLWVWLFRYAFFFWPAFLGLFPGFWVVKLVGVSRIFLMIFLSCGFCFYFFAEGLWLGFALIFWCIILVEEKCRHLQPCAIREFYYGDKIVIFG
jgi:hypothetical protein